MSAKTQASTIPGTIVRATYCPNTEVRDMHANERDGVPEAQTLHMLDCFDCNKFNFPDHIGESNQSDWYKKGHRVWCKKCYIKNL